MGNNHIKQFQNQSIFKPFNQLNESTADLSGGNRGAGLGLSISQHLCHVMGGYISVESTVGKGSTFTIQLPVNVVT